MKTRNFLFLVAMFVSIPFVAKAVEWTAENWKGTGSRWNTTEFEIWTSTDGTAQHFRPGTNNANDLGTSVLAFRNIYSNNIQAVGTNPAFQFGTGAVVSATATATTSLGTYFTGYLSGTTNALEGSFLCATTTVSGQGVSVTVCPAFDAILSWVVVITCVADPVLTVTEIPCPLSPAFCVTILAAEPSLGQQ